MGSTPWKVALERRLTNAAKDFGPAGMLLGVRRARRTHMGFFVGCAGGYGRPWYLVLECKGEERLIPLDRHTWIDGLSAPDWERTR